MTGSERQGPRRQWAADRSVVVTAVLLIGLVGALVAPALAQETTPDLAAAPAVAKEWDGLPAPEALGKGNDCTWARTIDDWDHVDRDHIIVKSGMRQRFLVRFSGTCTVNPAFGLEIGVVSRDSQLCPYGGDALIIDGERCTILNIWKLPDTKR